MWDNDFHKYWVNPKLNIYSIIQFYQLSCFELLHLYLYLGQYWVLLWDVRYLLVPVPCLYLASPLWISSSNLSFCSLCSLYTKPTWHSTFLLTRQTCPKSVWDLPCARFDLDNVLGSSNRITETTPPQPMRTGGGFKVLRLKIYKHQSPSF